MFKVLKDSYFRVAAMTLLLACGAGLILPAAAVADVAVQISSEDSLLVSYWAGGMAVTSRAVVCEGVSRQRPAVDLEGAEPDESLAGAPALPFVSCRVLLPPSQTVADIRIASQEDEKQFSLSGPMAFVNQSYEGYDMTDPGQALAWAASNHEDGGIYAADAWYPPNPVGFNVRNFRGYQILKLKFTPFRYHPHRNLLEFTRHLKLEVILRDASGDGAGFGCRASAKDRMTVERMVVNPEEAAEYQAAARRKNGAGPLSLNGEEERPMGGANTNYYVIITPAQFTPDFEPLRSFHSYDADHQAAIVTVEDIYAYYPGTNTPNFMKIHDYICHVLYSNGCEYVLIGGDTEWVPTYYEMSDFAYSTWQIPVGRFSVESTVEISNCIVKAMRPVSNGTDKVLLVPRIDEYGPTLYSYSNYFLPYLPVESDSSVYTAGTFHELFSAMDTHTILWARGHGYYLRPQWAGGWYPPNNTHIQPFGINFGCKGCVVEWNSPYDHPAEVYHRAANGNAAYVGTVEDVYASGFDETMLRSYFVEGTAGPAVGDMMMMGLGQSTYYTLLGDPLYEIVSTRFKAMPRITLPWGGSTSRSYNTDQGGGSIEDVVFRIMSFNNCGWLITNIACESAISNHIAFSCLSSNQPADVHVSFYDVTNIPPGNYAILCDVLDTTNALLRQTKYIYLYVTDKNILTDEDFIHDGNRNLLPAGQYYLASDLVVDDGTILEFMPGVSLASESYGAKVVITMGASIKALGSVTNQILFHVPFEISGADLMPLAGYFKYCYFDSGAYLTTTNRPIINFLNCTFIVGGGGPASLPLFTADCRGTMTNCLVTAGPMHARGPVGDMSGIDVNYCCIVPDYLAFNTPPVFPVHGRNILWGNDFLPGGGMTGRVISTYINSGDPASPPDPDGTRADIGAFYVDLSGALHVPGNYPTLQAAIDAASSAPGDFVIVVSNGVYEESIVISNEFDNAIRIIGESETNRPVLCLNNDPGNLVTIKSRNGALFENMIFQHTGLGGVGRTVLIAADWANAGFKNCVFSGNAHNDAVLCIDMPGFCNGSALYAWDTDFINNRSNSVILDIREKIAPGDGEPWSWLRNCRFTNNTACGSVFSFGPVDRNLFTRELTFAGNSAQRLIWNYGGWTVTNTTLTFENALLHDNAGYILTENRGYTLFENCTFHNNASNMMAGGIMSKLALHNSVFWDNTMILTNSLGGFVKVDFTDINSAIPPFGGGEGNLCTNPLFVSVADRDFHLQRSSPCIDAGDTNSSYLNEPFPNGQRVNMGRYGNTPEAETWRLDIPVTNIVCAAGEFHVCFPAGSNSWYGIEFTPSLFLPWVSIWTNTATGETMRILLPVQGDQGFYRIHNYRP